MLNVGTWLKSDRAKAIESVQDTNVKRLASTEVEERHTDRPDATKLDIQLVGFASLVSKLLK